MGTSQRFYPFGHQRLITTNTAPTGEPIDPSIESLPTDRGYTNQTRDDTTGLLFYNARYYDPTTARFTQADTIIPDPTNPADLNRYTYVRNSPLVHTDPSGNEPCHHRPGGCTSADFNHQSPATTNTAYNASWTTSTAGSTPCSMSYCNYSSSPGTGPDVLGATGRFLEPTFEGLAAIPGAFGDFIVSFGPAAAQVPGNGKDAVIATARTPYDVPMGVYHDSQGCLDGEALTCTSMAGGIYLRRIAPKSMFGGLKHADQGIKPYSVQRKVTAGHNGDIQAHHLIEKRFKAIMGGNTNDWPTIVVTKAEHQQMTNAWRAKIPYGQGTRTATRSQIQAAARDIYQDYPEILEALDLD